MCDLVKFNKFMPTWQTDAEWCWWVAAVPAVAMAVTAKVFLMLLNNKSLMAVIIKSIYSTQHPWLPETVFWWRGCGSSMLRIVKAWGLTIQVSCWLWKSQVTLLCTLANLGLFYCSLLCHSVLYSVKSCGVVVRVFGSQQ